jgi:subtilisin family serine protease/dienelactone hydrolase
MRYFIAILITTFQLLAAARELPTQPGDPVHPGSDSYTYGVKRLDFQLNGRKMNVFLPVGESQKFPVIVYGHGQALDVDAYDATFEHLAKKGIAVIFPGFDTGFFDRDWRRMAADFNRLTEEAFKRHENFLDADQIVYSGHSKGGYIALMAAGAPNLNAKLAPKSIVLFAPAGFDAEYIKRVNINIPVSIIWGESDSIIKRTTVDEIYNLLPSKYKQFIEPLNYPNSNLKADHFFMMNRSYFFGGFEGTSALHYYGAWKWLIGAVLDLKTGARIDNVYLYGDQASSSGWSDFQHKVNRSTQLKIQPLLKQKMLASKSEDVLVYFKPADNFYFVMNQAANIGVREQRLRYIRNFLIASANTTQRRAVQILDAAEVTYKSFYIANVISIKKANPELLTKLAALSEVERIKNNTQATLNLPPVERANFFDGLDDVPGHIERVEASKVWRELGVRGKGIVVGSQDTGVYWEHNAIKNQYRGNKDGKVDHNYNWLDAMENLPAPIDDTSHGTHTVGTMVGFDGRDRKIGVAPDAQWIGCRNMKDGVGTLESYLTCFEFFMAPYPIGGDPKKDGRPDLAPHIVNNSWACPPGEGCSPGDLIQAVQAMRAAGILVVAAAGNEGSACGSVGSPPGTYSEDLISVGAYNRFTKDAASFSSRGPSAWDGGLVPHLVAPGELITSAVTGGPDKYKELGGTSMAAPQIAGVAALLWSSEPWLIGKIEKTMEILKASAMPLKSSQSCGKFNGGNVPNATFGYGHVKAYEAIMRAKKEQIKK